MDITLYTLNADTKKLGTTTYNIIVLHEKIKWRK